MSPGADRPGEPSGVDSDARILDAPPILVPPPGHPVGPLRDAARTVAQRQRLQRLADALAWSLGPQAVAAQLVEAACTTLGAPQGWVAVRTSDGRAVEMIASRGYAEEAVAPWRRVPIEVDVPMTVVVRTGVGVAHESSAERVRDYPVLAESGSARNVEASAVVPMVFEGRTIGALAITFDDVRAIDDADRWFLESLAAQGAGALERARLFEAVRERDERLQLALAASGTWIWEWDVAADVVEWTPTPPDEPAVVSSGAPGVSRTWLSIVDPEDAPALATTIEAAVSAGGPYEVEFRIRVGDQVRWIQASGRAISATPGRPERMMGTARDITERKMAELDRDRRLEAERDAAQLRDAFISVVSHELRTPITTIFGGTRVLARRWRAMEPGARDALLTDVAGEADRLYRLVEDLLVLTRVERGPLDVGDEPVALRPIIERVLASERVRSPEVGFETRVPPDLPSVRGEDTYIEQVLRNLLSNAAKYGGAGSVVTIAAEADAEAVSLLVLDEGPGIAEAEAEQLFDLFYRSPSTAPTVTGAGIGLFVCRQLALAMGGSIRAEQRAGGGAAFTLRLQRYEDDGDA